MILNEITNPLYHHAYYGAWCKMTQEELAQVCPEIFSLGFQRRIKADATAISQGVAETVVGSNRIISATEPGALKKIKKFGTPKHILSENVLGVTILHAQVPFASETWIHYGEWILLVLAVWIFISIILVKTWIWITGLSGRGEVPSNKEDAEKKFEDEEQMKQIKEWKEKHKK